MVEIMTYGIVATLIMVAIGAIINGILEVFKELFGRKD